MTAFLIGNNASVKRSLHFVKSRVFPIGSNRVWIFLIGNITRRFAWVSEIDVPEREQATCGLQAKLMTNA